MFGCGDCELLRVVIYGLLFSIAFSTKHFATHGLIRCCSDLRYLVISRRRLMNGYKTIAINRELLTNSDISAEEWLTVGSRNEPMLIPNITVNKSNKSENNILNSSAFNFFQFLSKIIIIKVGTTVDIIIPVVLISTTKAILPTKINI